MTAHFRRRVEIKRVPALLMIIAVTRGIVDGRLDLQT